MRAKEREAKTRSADTYPSTSKQTRDVKYSEKDTTVKVAGCRLLENFILPPIRLLKDIVRSTSQLKRHRRRLLGQMPGIVRMMMML
jgi:hypothetical protein